MPRNHPTTSVKKFTGLDESAPARRLDKGALAVANNVDISRELEVSRRPGATSIYSGAVDAAWGDGGDLLFVAAGSLRAFDGVIQSTLGAVTGTPDYLHGVRIPTGVVLTTGSQVWVLGLPEYSLVTYGVEVPSTPDVVVVPGGGALKAGRVLIAVTGYHPGRGEGASSKLLAVDVTAGARLTVTLPAVSDGARLRLYMSSEDGTVPMLQYEGLSSDVVAVAGVSDSRALDTHGMGAPSGPARTLGIHNGRLLYAEHNILWYSEPFAYERFRLAQAFIPFGDPINLIASAGGGVFVGTEQEHYFLAGEDITNARIDGVVSYGAALTQPVGVNEHEHNMEGLGDTPVMWTTARGIVVGGDGGSLVNLSDSKVNLGSAQRATGAMRRSSSLNQLVICARS